MVATFLILFSALLATDSLRTYRLAVLFMGTLDIDDVL
ncbi:hypothetical protein SNOG_00846 [Parastagonospora nodorum SN15]|uniref:Uncharacterized protein n=1 Tax=Phaeosphaeria nodorum (strain SN15 / ATCC MYA-4574 / FGSC 10173) TaxID=321614 RepID=Q0V568_PHANO|nr:hypothetical protein SNOG_00846 [Parastagonospora nodorum SN15]EAT92341.1 hypothetical protein SNOG_00846 [Parastagonospora nodorum SN15]